MRRVIAMMAVAVMVVRHEVAVMRGLDVVTLVVVGRTLVWPGAPSASCAMAEWAPRRMGMVVVMPVGMHTPARRTSKVMKNRRQE